MMSKREEGVVANTEVQFYDFSYLYHVVMILCFTKYFLLINAHAHLHVHIYTYLF